MLVLRHPYASVYLSEFGGGPCKPSSLRGVVGQWLAAWRRVYGLVAADALAADATVMFRTEDLLLDEERTRAALRDLVAPRRRRALLTIRGAERGFAVDASHAFVRLSVEFDFSVTWLDSGRRVRRSFVHAEIRQLRALRGALHKAPRPWSLGGAGVALRALRLRPARADEFR